MQIQQMLDACLFGLSFWCAWEIRSNSVVREALNLPQIEPFGSFVWLYLVLIIAGPLILEAQGFYGLPLLAPRRQTIWALFKGCLFSSVAIILVLFFMRLTLARGVAVLFGGVSFFVIFAKEEILQLTLKSKFGRLQFQRRFILVGLPEETKEIRRDLQRNPEDGMLILAELDLSGKPIEKLSEMLHEYSANGVILYARHSHIDTIENAIVACEMEGVEVWLITDFFKTKISHTSFDDFLGRPVLVFRTTPEASWQSVAKHALDLGFSLIFTVVVFWWLFLLIALLIKITSRGPVLFRQQRSGLNGQPFTIFKFRTMHSDAEQRKSELQAMNEMSGPVFKMTNDPRVTWIGKYLRKFSIDEFPQILNVMRGEMSLVGPRPLPVDEVKRFDDDAHRRRLSVKPGLTCLWQISGRSNLTDFKEWVRLDLEYIDNWSLWLDLKIICRTVPVVLFGSGAH